MVQTPTEAANILEVSEHQIFEDAAIAWFRKFDGELVEWHFKRYLHDGDIPYWVRHYCRQIPEPESWTYKDYFRKFFS